MRSLRSALGTGCLLCLLLLVTPGCGDEIVTLSAGGDSADGQDQGAPPANGNGADPQAPVAEAKVLGGASRFAYPGYDRRVDAMQTPARGFGVFVEGQSLVGTTQVNMSVREDPAMAPDADYMAEQRCIDLDLSQSAEDEPVDLFVSFPVDFDPEFAELDLVLELDTGEQIPIDVQTADAVDAAGSTAGAVLFGGTESRSVSSAMGSWARDNAQRARDVQAAGVAGAQGLLGDVGKTLIGSAKWVYGKAKALIRWIKRQLDLLTAPIRQRSVVNARLKEWLPEDGTAEQVDPVSPQIVDPNWLEDNQGSWIDRTYVTKDRVAVTVLVPDGDTPPTALYNLPGYRRITPVAAGERVAVIVHGLGSEIDNFKNLAGWLSDLESTAPDGSDRRRYYDRIYGFDYRSTAFIRHLGSALAYQLQEVIGGPGGNVTTVDVFAHSMGGLVSRYAIEEGNKPDALAVEKGRRAARPVLDWMLQRGDERLGPYVDHLVTLGSPHQGVPFAALGPRVNIYGRKNMRRQWASVQDLLTISYAEATETSANVFSGFLYRLNKLSSVPPYETEYYTAAGTDESDAGHFNRAAYEAAHPDLVLHRDDFEFDGCVPVYSALSWRGWASVLPNVDGPLSERNGFWDLNRDVATEILDVRHDDLGDTDVGATADLLFGWVSRWATGASRVLQP